MQFPKTVYFVPTYVGCTFLSWVIGGEGKISVAFNQKMDAFQFKSCGTWLKCFSLNPFILLHSDVG